MPRPLLSNETVAATLPVTVRREDGKTQTIDIAGERALALYVNKRELITLMTLGQMPEALAVGWLLSQRLIKHADDIEEVRVDWEVNAAAVYTRVPLQTPPDARRTVTSGCGQGTMFSRLMEEVETLTFKRAPLFTARALTSLLEQVRQRDTVYKRAGAVHACALAEQDGETASLLCFVEDIGRHNAADAIAGWMQLNAVRGDGKVFYTTGRLTSEMVIKCAQMGIPYLVSRSGTTAMGYHLANTIGITMLGRAINTRYIIFSAPEHFT